MLQDFRNLGLVAVSGIRPSQLCTASATSNCAGGTNLYLPTPSSLFTQGELIPGNCVVPTQTAHRPCWNDTPRPA